MLEKPLRARERKGVTKHSELINYVSPLCVREGDQKTWKGSCTVPKSVGSLILVSESLFRLKSFHAIPKVKWFIGQVCETHSRSYLMLLRTVTARVINERAGYLGWGRGWGQSTTRSYFPRLNNFCNKDCWFYASSLGLTGVRSPLEMQEREERIRRVEPETPSALRLLPANGWESLPNRAAVAAAAHSVLKHLEEHRNGNKKGRATLGMTELEGIKSEASGCCVTPEKDDRHISKCHSFPNSTLGAKNSDRRPQSFGLCTTGLGIWLVSRTQSLCNFAIALFPPIFSSCYTFPIGHWVSPATLLSLANSCIVQNHWGAEVALVCFHSILWGFRSCDDLWVLPALEHCRHVACSWVFCLFCLRLRSSLHTYKFHICGYQPLMKILPKKKIPDTSRSKACIWGMLNTVLNTCYMRIRMSCRQPCFNLPPTLRLCVSLTHLLKCCSDRRHLLSVTM